MLKPHDLLYHPLWWESGTSIAQRYYYYENIDLSFQLSIGNTVIPEMPTMGVADNYKHLQETRNNHVSIKPRMYRDEFLFSGVQPQETQQCQLHWTEFEEQFKNGCPC